MAEAFLGTDRMCEPEGMDAAFDPVSAAAWADGTDPTADLDGDGVRETVVFDTEVPAAPDIGGPDIGALVVATDTDLDGYTDRMSVVADDGEYGVWEFRRDGDGTPQWTRIDEGTLGMT
ncbi:DUF6802 family protein [Rhodococcus chondri]|uniref:DUF6802 domain-containing protein n=1 Tax=Rhodococcus chondri TaxID=3065941 RepID=A0ABU7JVQ1_9NOCA|nr:DUF6802 family protein [Rhodococcus sp. CC-R104]MEE2034101.1 hypothetical protein [Rhodococcus sp. CC-R104]